MSPRITIGIFVGGKGTRMGGLAKGLLRTPDGAENLVERLLRQCAHAAPHAPVLLVGQSAPYATLGLPQLNDDPIAVGPIGGLRALLLHAQTNQSALALALACDLPFLDESVISALISPFSGAAHVPFVEGRLQPLAAAYVPTATLNAVNQSLAVRKHALMHVLELLGGELQRLEFDDERAHTLRDWDTPEDILR